MSDPNEYGNTQATMHVYDDFNTYFGLLIWKFNLETHKRMIPKVTWEALPNDGAYRIDEPPPFIFLREDAQALMDRMWSAGLRPTEGTGSAGAMAATQTHLKDVSNYVTWLMKMLEMKLTE